LVLTKIIFTKFAKIFNYCNICFLAMLKSIQIDTSADGSLHSA
jgi:hypothetical protein